MVSKKNKVRNRNVLLVVVILISFILALSSWYVFNNPFQQAALPYEGIIPDTTTITKIQETDFDATFRVSFALYPIGSNFASCDSKSPQGITITNIKPAGDYRGVIKGDLNLEQSSTTEIVTLSGVSAIANPCTDIAQGRGVDWQNEKAECSSYVYNFNGNDYIGLNCKVQGTLVALKNGQPADGSFFGLSGASLEITFLKEEYECSNKLPCEVGDCENGKCIFKNCNNGEEKCEGTNNFICENYDWINKGQVEGKCGYFIDDDVIDDDVIDDGDIIKQPDYLLIFLISVISILLITFIITKLIITKLKKQNGKNKKI